MFGITNTSGLLFSSIEYVLARNENVFVSFIEIFKTNVFDLGSGQRQGIKSIESAMVLPIQSFDSFKDICTKVLAARKQKSTDQNATSSRSHLVICFSSNKNPANRMAFIDLAGWECPKNKEDMTETQFINKTLSEFNQTLALFVSNKVATFNSELGKIFKPYLTDKSHTCMFYHVSNGAMQKGLENIKGIVASAKADHKRAPFRDMSNISRFK